MKAYAIFKANTTITNFKTLLERYKKCTINALSLYKKKFIHFKYPKNPKL